MEIDDWLLESADIGTLTVEDELDPVVLEALFLSANTCIDLFKSFANALPFSAEDFT